MGNSAYGRSRLSHLYQTLCHFDNVLYDAGILIGDGRVNNIVLPSYHC